ncbi:hypothetical protein NQD34_001953, partial [Periophthalmus magnuspinnatus]
MMENWEVDSGPADHCSEIRTVERSDMAPDRTHVNVLLELSEEEFMKDLHPPEYQCNQGWEEAVSKPVFFFTLLAIATSCITDIFKLSLQVCGWARVAPLALLLLAEKTDYKSKHKDAENDSFTSVETDNLAEQPSETQRRPPTRVRTRISSQNTWSCTRHNAPNPTSESLEIPFVDGISKQMAQLTLADQTRDSRTPFQHHQVMADSRSPKPRKNSLKTNNALVPIKNFTFLPPIIMPQNQQNFKKHQQGESGLENF